MRLLQQLFLALLVAPALVSASIVVSLNTTDFLNETNATIQFQITVTNETNTLQIVNASIWGNFSGNWAYNVSNSSALSSGVGYVFNVTGIPEGVYVWNANVSAKDVTFAANFSAVNKTLIVDRTKPKFIRATGLNSSFYAQGLGLTRYYVVYANTSFRITINNTVNTTSPNTAIKNVTLQYNSTLTNLGADAGTAVETNGTVFYWNLNANLNATYVPEGAANLTVNITDYAGNSEVITASSFLTGSESLPLYANNWPLIQTRSFNPRLGFAFNSSSPASYNLTMRIKAENFGGFSGSTFSRDFAVNSQGEAFLSINDSSYTSTIYRIIMFINGSNGNASHASTDLPPIPVTFLAPPGRPRTGFNIYAAPAETIRLNVTNGTHCTRFFGMIQDKDTGVMVRFFDNQSALNSTGGILFPCSLVEAIVPANRNYTITLGNPPNNVGSNGHAFPPRTFDVTTANLSDSDTSDFAGVALNVLVNTTFSIAWLGGNVTTNSSATVNISNAGVDYLGAYAYMMAGDFLPPMPPAQTLTASQVNGTTSFNFTSLPTGTTYLIVVFGNNSGTYYAGYAKVTLTANTQQNITLRKLAGSFRTTNDFSDFVNTSKTRLSFIDSNGSSISSDMNAEVILNFSSIFSGVTLRRNLRSQGSSNIDVPVLRDTAIRVRGFSMQYAPIERNFDSGVVNSNATINITMKLPEYRKPREGGSDKDFLSTLVVDMYDNSATCNVPEPPGSCSFSSKFPSMKKVGSTATGNHSGGESFKGEFDPFETNMGGNLINMRVFDTATNSTIYMMGVDMASSGQPQMELDSDRFEKREASGGRREEIRRFGSFVPDNLVKDKIWVANPYNESEANESAPMNVSIPYLYDDDGVLVWNSSVNTSAQIPLKYQDYITHFNVTGVGNASMLSNITCSDTFNSSNANQRCYRNTTVNVVWLLIPHFSTIAVSVAGSTSSSSGSGGGGSSSSGAGGIFVTITPTPTTAPTPTSTPTLTPTQTPTPLPATTPAPTAPTATAVPTARAEDIQNAYGEINRVNSLLEDARNSGIDVSEAERLLELARSFAAQGQAARAVEYAEQARQRLEGQLKASATPTPAGQSRAAGVDFTLIGGVILLVILAYVGYAATRKK